ncbi:hypothetical protein BO78DRAFT_384273 [Aspergillus sclerotiicarbonarius CBS 121057]|uniref:Uncharacterized protein n=1 Tax=Aspergillus sclerotiicarbonarius (strain CBS 121057 / IBT 28362) TaxID=1448318 RepID=A0A319EGA0_ASPSB|nr:hypothetical protein BO78DRAFT_384273 [Aspergillus sclerotiicarbonarius CBS 121057]
MTACAQRQTIPKANGKFNNTNGQNRKHQDYRLGAGSATTGTNREYFLQQTISPLDSLFTDAAKTRLQNPNLATPDNLNPLDPGSYQLASSDSKSLSPEIVILQPQYETRLSLLIAAQHSLLDYDVDMEFFQEGVQAQMREYQQDRLAGEHKASPSLAVSKEEHHATTIPFTRADSSFFIATGLRDTVHRPDLLIHANPPSKFLPMIQGPDFALPISNQAGIPRP